MKQDDLNKNNSTKQEPDFDIWENEKDYCNHYDTSISTDNYIVCNDCGAYLEEL